MRPPALRVAYSDSLPKVDEHVCEVAAASSRCWEALLAALPRAFGGSRNRWIAALLGCEDSSPAGRLPEPGSALVGFRVRASEPPRELVLVGAHRFARYQLSFRIDPQPTGGGSWIRAETCSEFPGAAGAIYRALVIGSGAHAVVVRRLLGGVAHFAQRQT